ncbi:MAG: hypothetical protein OZ921_16090 [Sorangiineae bacterium]|nr:hypothetical protein [Sorangiineae bacterium]MEB2343298.1 hypothetical protein [Deltaproteobacteria bacterium]
MMRRVARSIHAALVLAGTLLGAACGHDETRVTPLTRANDASADAGEDAPRPPDAVAPLRTVESRNPFGRTTLVENLLVDGDFELSSGSGQYGFIAYSAGGQALLARETGGLCRSGVTCGVLTSGTSLLGYGAAARGKSLAVTLWAKPPEPDCSLVWVSVTKCNQAFGGSTSVLPVEAAPDATGWCRYEEVLPPMDEQPCLFVSTAAAAGARTLVDDASLVAVEGSGAKPRALRAPDPAREARIAEVLDWARRHRRY